MEPTASPPTWDTAPRKAPATLAPQIVRNEIRTAVFSQDRILNVLYN